VEHSLSEESIAQLNKFIDFIENCPEEEARWLKHFGYFSDHGKLPPDCRDEDDCRKDKRG